MRKFLCIVSNIILTIVYIPMSWFASLLMWAAFDGYIANWTFSFDGIISFLFIALFFLTPVFSLLGIVLSIVKWVKKPLPRCILGTIFAVWNTRPWFCPILNLENLILLTKTANEKSSFAVFCFI